MNLLQSTILMIAKDVKKICDKHDIKYILNGGSLLGAIRHKGFIPWDDDFDIEMPRDEYERFLKLCESELDSKKYFLQTDKSEPKYPFAFAKIQLRGTKFLEDFSENVDVQKGIFIDIFPVDMLPKNSRKEKCHMFVDHLLKNMLWIKCGYGTKEMKKKWSYKIVKILALPFSIPLLKMCRRSWITKYDAKEGKFYYSSDYPKARRRADWYKRCRLYEFEDTVFRGPMDADGYLKTMFGDYMKMPPENERRRHTSHEVDFGCYKQFYENEGTKTKKYDIGITVGVFDCLHDGHLNLFEHCKTFCEHLVVGICDDKYVKEIKKKIPVYDATQRLRLVKALKMVDDAFIVSVDETEDKMLLLKNHKFDVLFSGDDWKGSERYIKTEKQFAKVGVNIEYLPYTQGISTSMIKEKIGMVSENK